MDKLKDWLKGLEYQVLAGDPDMEVSDVVYDSRKAEPHTVFVCMAGSRIDSHDFIPEVYQKGCRAFVVEKDRESLLQDQALRDLLQEGTEEAPTVIRVENARHASYSARFYRHAGAGNCRRCRDAAEKRHNDVADALRHQFAIAVQTRARHARSSSTAQKAFNHRQNGDTDSRR